MVPDILSPALKWTHSVPWEPGRCVCTLTVHVSVHLLTEGMAGSLGSGFPMGSVLGGGLARYTGPSSLMTQDLDVRQSC